MSRLRNYDLAKKLGVENKIDWERYESDEIYSRKWNKILPKAEKYANIINSSSKQSLKDIDCKNFTNRNLAIKSFAEQVHEDYDVSKLDTDLKFESEEIKMIKPEKIPIKTKCHIIDVDYEIRGELFIVLYTRDVNSATTNTVLVPYSDYFYIKLTQKHTEQSVKKAISGYTWFLREKRYPMSKIPDLEYFDTRRHETKIDLDKPLVKKMEVVTNLKSMYGYQPNNQTFLKVTTANPLVTNHLFQGLPKKFPDMEFFEASIDVTNKFLTEYKLSACVVIEVEGIQHTPNKISTCDRLIISNSIKLVTENVPFYKPRTMFYDIECLSLDINVFPTSDTCPVIQISYLLMDGEQNCGQGVLCYKDTPGYDSYETEEGMLLRFFQIIVEFNPDFLTGYNSNNFDMPYLIDRLKVLGIFDIASQFSRAKNYYVDYKRTFKQSKQFGTKEVVKYTIPGRVMFDQFEVIKGDATKKLRSYALKSVCAEYLGDDNKEDLKYKEIPELFKTPEGRCRIASYCLQDTLLLHKLDNAVMLGITCIGMTKVLGVTPDIALNRGLVYKLMCKLKQYTERANLLIPAFTESQKPVFEGTYQGAFVLDPSIGYYKDPVCVLDFASLYPSLMIGWNLSYETIVFDKSWLAENPDSYEMHCGIPFVKHSVRKGIVPLLEEEMAKQRKAAKKKKAASKKGSVEEAIYDSEQLANKIVMNSLYGMLGSPTASVPCVEIAKTITGLGRENLLAAKEYAEEHYTRITGEKINCKVIYGDTDSIFIHMPNIDVETSIKYGQMLDKEIQRDVFEQRKPMQLEYEKVFCPFIITRRKGYCGAKYEFSHTDFKISAMGFQLVRRDAAKLCQDTMQTYFDFLLKDRDEQKALKSIQLMVKDLASNSLPLESFEITKKIAKNEYKTVPPHVIAWRRMVQRVGKSDAPAVGERFEFIVTRMTKKNRDMGQAMVDMQLVREEGFQQHPIDKEYYFKTFIFNPMAKIMELVHGKEIVDKVLNLDNYEVTTKVVASNKNILGFFGKKSFTQKRKLVDDFDVDDKEFRENCISKRTKQTKIEYN